MAQIILEPGDTCEVEDNQDSGWMPNSIDELIVTLVSKQGSLGHWKVEAEATGRTGIVHESYLHLKT